MTFLTRRQFGGMGGAALVTLAAPRIGRAQGKPRVVVIGGGIGGSTVARYLSATNAIDVTLVEPKQRYITCFFSSLYLAGLRSLESLSHGYETLAHQHGITIVHQRASMVDPIAKTIALEDGSKLSYDRLVMAPGIDFTFGGIEGYDQAATEVMPHAWNAGPQSELLRRQLESMEDGGVFVIAPPANPFRCPPAPYERASLVAYYFKQFKPKSKIIILDAKDTFSGQALFEDAWARDYPGMIEWLPMQFTGGVKAVDLKAMSVVTGGDAFKAAVANIIPAQTAGRLAAETALTNETGWSPVDPTTFASTLQPDIHLVGDAIIGGDMPKSAYSANSQAKACAFAIAAALTGSETFPAHLFNSCYTFLAPNDAFTNALNFAPDDTGKLKTVDTFISKVGESAEVRLATARQAVEWYGAFTHDVFG